MARYDSEHKDATRRRIVETAGRRIKQDGIDGSGIKTLMADAGLTNGAFYAHFASKDDLVARIVAAQLDGQLGAVDQLPPGLAGLEQWLRSYLSTAHREATAEGCPSAALLDEIVRAPLVTRQAYTVGLLAIVDALAAHAAPELIAPTRAQLLSINALLFGTLQLARALTDEALADALLEQGLRDALVLLDRLRA